MSNIKKLTLLHSNDMHGDFLAEEVDEQLIGGVSMLSGYVSKVREEEKNSIYCIAGDMFRGSVIDSEFRGISTIEIMNMLSPDVVTIGNHEIDYGISHLLFLEKCAKFPIINANLHITTNNYYEKQRRQNAVKVRKDTRENEGLILNKKASSLRVAKYAGEYYALKKRQEGHGKVWRFFHKKENEQRTKLLSIMEKTLKTVLKDDDKLEDLDPKKIAEIYNKQQLTGRLNETVQSGIAKRNEIPTNFFKHTPTITARADKEIDNPNQEDIELEDELRMPLVFDDEFKKESEAVTMTYVKKVDDKIVTQTVVHDDGHIEVDLSDKSPVAKF